MSLVLDRKFLEVIHPYPTYKDLDDLARQFDNFYKDCITGILDENEKQYQDNYVAMNGTYSVLKHIHAKYNVKGRASLESMEDRMFFIQKSKRNRDELFDRDIAGHNQKSENNYGKLFNCSDRKRE